MSDKVQQAKDASAGKAYETKQYGQEKAAQAQQNAQGVTDTVKEKLSQTGQAAQNKLEETKQALFDATRSAKDRSSNSSQASQDKTRESQEQAGGLLDQAKGALQAAVDKTKAAFSSDEQKSV